jgi:two-component system response regulator FlrC
MSKTKILIVEDDDGLREALVDTLLLGGYQVTPVDCAENAMIKLADNNQFDLVVSDIQMGAMSGLSLLKSVKAKYPKLPVLLMTAFANIDDAIQAMRDGATDYLSKPFAPEVLLNLVGRYAPSQKVESRTPIVADPSSTFMIRVHAANRYLLLLTVRQFLKICWKRPYLVMRKVRLPAQFKLVRVNLNKPKAARYC